ncbi:hypothetical protein ACOQFV_24515 [Nocardiopsis changdeensis]|uniref:Uncharacterized protein n=1 Tax=Nocardiopsis changdeensis TaxID=2831969 RepID=A0A975KS21_9ACTN|nr:MULTISPECIES: hypothetical protein [Nocardiopsis]QUX26445.1 hypothetical protein KGD84_32625 [Nocardiopsis changdeensis]QYX40717.1 hypothetical protein K1J57_32475 [Nocardiopsis sp. MT53]
MFINTTRFMQWVEESGTLARLPTTQVAELLDEVEVMKVADEQEAQTRDLVFGALKTELGRRYDEGVQAMDSTAIIEALAPIADVGTHRSESTGVLYNLYVYALTVRHPEARAAERAWADTVSEYSPEFEAGPAGRIIDAVRAVLDR